jgi:D-sedoheptulose 7-phosphate isomerase
MPDNKALSPNLGTNLESYVTNYLDETVLIAKTIDKSSITALIKSLEGIRSQEGRLFILGIGGSAGNASHAVNDFRKIARIECYAPTDNVSELTARINDESWESVFASWLTTSKINKNDGVLVFSVGGGSEKTSYNLVKAMELAKSKGAKILSIVSRNGGSAKELSDVCVLVPVVNDKAVTPHAEGWQAVVWHLVVNALCKD